MTEKDINRKDFLFDPFSKSLFDDLAGKYVEFEGLGEGKFKKYKSEICRFIVLCYDKNSVLVRKISDLFERKRTAAILAGFKSGSDGKYPKIVEDIILLNNEELSKAVVRYLIIFGLPEMLALTAEITALASETFAIQTGTSKKMKESLDNIRTTRIEINKLVEEIFGGKEVIEARKVLYEGIMVKSLYRPESFIKRLDSGEDLEDCNPYPNGYKVDKMKFIGDE